MHKLIEYICDELEDLERKAEKDGKLSMTEIQYMDTLAHAKKNLLKSEEMMGEDEEYSMAGGSYAYARNGRDGGRSNASYARGRGRNARRDSMGRYSSENRYSREGGYSMAEDDFRMDIEDLMQNAPNERVKQKLRELMSEM